LLEFVPPVIEDLLLMIWGRPCCEVFRADLVVIKTRWVILTANKNDHSWYSVTGTDSVAAEGLREAYKETW
jgi:hypothetical protein